VATPGHTANHLSVVLEDGGLTYFLAGDASYAERYMLAGCVDGVSEDDDVARETLTAIGRFARSRPTVYLPTHDPGSAARMASRTTVAP
jgi:glyoxylase-like metal-dependent hydrolase (beta-lactamase superfamily II)